MSPKKKNYLLKRNVQRFKKYTALYVLCLYRHKGSKNNVDLYKSYIYGIKLFYIHIDYKYYSTLDRY